MNSGFTYLSQTGKLYWSVPRTASVLWRISAQWRSKRFLLKVSRLRDCFGKFSHARRESDPAQRCGSYSRTPTHPPPASSNRYMCGPSKLAGLRPLRPSPTPVVRTAKRPEPHSDTEISALLTTKKSWLTSALGVSNEST